MIMTVLLIIAAYIACIIAFIAWDAFIGFPYEFDGHELPPLCLVAIFWPLALPFVFFDSLTEKFSKIKKNRIAKEEKRNKLRIAAQKEIDNYMHEAEEEMKKILRSKE